MANSGPPRHDRREYQGGLRRAVAQDSSGRTRVPSGEQAVRQVQGGGRDTHAQNMALPEEHGSRGFRKD
eukprot:9496005-Pyramimonas_sp.AAC.1